MVPGQFEPLKFYYISGLLIGFLMTMSNLCFFSSLLTFFVMGSKVTKYKAKEKQKFEENYKEGNTCI